MNFSKLRRYTGPQSSHWPDKEFRDEMRKDVQIIQTKADEIYKKFMSHSVSQVLTTHLENELHLFHDVDLGQSPF